MKKDGTSCDSVVPTSNLSASVSTGVDIRRLADVFKICGKSGQLTVSFIETGSVPMPCFIAGNVEIEDQGVKLFINPIGEDTDEEDEEDASETSAE